MSYEDGWAALNMEMPRRIPRTEYSAEGHFELVSRVTGMDVNYESPEEVKEKAKAAFVREWNYDFFWNVMIHRTEFDAKRTDMGHAEYADGGTDYREKTECPFATPEEALALDMFETYGTRDVPEYAARFTEHYEESCNRRPTGVNMTGIYTTLVSGFVEIFGWEMMLLAAGTDPEAFGRLTNRYAEWNQHFFDALAECESPVVMVHDDIVWTAGPILRPDWYREFIFPNYKKYFRPLIDAGKRIVFTSDGDYTMFIDDIVETGVHCLVLEPTTDMQYIAENYGRTHGFIGNADTRILLSGTRDEIRAEVERCINIGRDCPGFFMAVGNHIPANTPVENALFYNEVYEELSSR